MSTMLWLPNTGSPAVTVTPSGTTWTLHDQGTRRPLNLSNVGASALATNAYAPDAADHLVAGSALHTQFISGVFPPQNIPSQVVKFSCVCLEAQATNNLFLRWTVYGVSSDGATNLGDIVPVQNDGTEMSTTVAGRTDFTAASTAQNFTQPWRMVLEIGANGTPTAGAGTDGHNFSISIGEGSSGHDFPQDTDATVNSTPPYLLFSTDFDVAEYFSDSMYGRPEGPAGARLTQQLLVR